MKVTYLTALSVFGASIILLADARSLKPAFTVKAQVQRSDTNSLILQLRIQDAKDKSGVCPYYVKTLQYLQGVKLLNVEVYQEFCTNEAYGKSEGDVFWTIPNSLLRQASVVAVLVNQ